ncbi:MAG: hypothetical protein WB952_26395 [Terriglobales bacterium]
MLFPTSPRITLAQTTESHPISARNLRARHEQWFLRGRLVPRQSAAALRYRAHQQKIQMRTIRAANSPGVAAPSSSAPAWTSLGPAPLASDASGTGQQDFNWVSGRATAVVVDPADASANTVYVGGAYGGVWKSSNAHTQDPANVTWTPLIDDQATLAVGAIAVQPQPTNPDATKSVILVGTGEANSSADSYYGLGILRSANAGGSWTLIPSDTTGTHSFAGMAFSKIAFSTGNPNLAVAATAGASEGIVEGLANPLTANLGLYYSTDGGLSWTYASAQDGPAATSPGSATTVVYNATAGLFFAALRYHGFYSSADGIHWTRLSNQPGSGLTAAACPAPSSSSNCPIYRGELSVVPGRNEMYAWYVDVNDNDQGIWTTTNGGASWTQLNENGITNCGDTVGCGTEDGTYNLELAAVPDGSATDLYAGAVNLYKCQITSASPACAGSGPNTFLNLTHAYGCSAIAKVHPAQHAASFLLVNSNQQEAMYFANDGGIYRVLDGYSGLTTGTCGSNNQFDSLNQTLGSLTQLVSFSQGSSDANTILTGAQGNGSPATQSALATVSWLNVNAGDGGNTQINPNNENEWFVSNPPDLSSGVNIFRCASGINCHSQDFQNDQVVSSTTLGGDAGHYYPQFMLDPQNSGEMVVGTCRVWRGTSGGAGFSLLSNNFETGGAGICTGDEINLVRSLAVGGPVDAKGFSNVMYAGTDGFGPLIPTIPAGGQVWVSTNAAGGASTWNNQTGAINPGAFPVSGIAIDSSDPTGLTAYVSIMGFSVSHVWKTSDGGVSWTDFSGSLPDTPANAVIVDPGTTLSNGMVYLATDVGVFSTFTASANWAEVGPAAGPGQSGYLPNVAVTALRMFNNQGTKLLRASTYGRGLWQFPITPSFAPSVANTPLTVFADQLPASFSGSVLFYGYTNSVNLSCEPPSQATCSVTPGSVTPAAPQFTITSNGPIGTSAFVIRGAGTDATHLIATAPFTLNVVDFQLTTPSPANLEVAPATISGPVTFQLTASGPFEQTVTLSCTGQPAGATCNFHPASAMQPTAVKPAHVALTISTVSATTAGTFPVTIRGSVVNGPTRTQNLLLTVTKDYSLAIGNPVVTASENTTVQLQGTLTSLNGYNDPVALSCGPGAPPTCSIAPTAVTPTSSGASFTAIVGSNQCGQYNFTIGATGTDSAATSHSAPVTFSSTSLAPPNFMLEIDNRSLTAAANTNATFNGTLSSSACYGSSVNLSCGSGAPPVCKTTPPSLTPTLAGAPFTVTVNSNRAATYNFGIAGQGTDKSAILHIFPVSFVSTSGSGSGFRFSIINTSGAEAVTAGQSATYKLQVAAATGSKFPRGETFTLSLSCPPLSTCGFSPAEMHAGSVNAQVQLTINTTRAVLASRKLSPGRLELLYSACLGWPLLIIASSSRRSRLSRRQFICLLLLTLATLSLMVACGGGLQGGGPGAAQPGTPAGTYNMTVSATPDAPTQPASIALTVN